MIGQIFEIILMMSLCGTMMIVFILLFTGLFKKYMSNKLIYRLNTLVILLLTVPFYLILLYLPIEIPEITGIIHEEYQGVYETDVVVNAEENENAGWIDETEIFAAQSEDKDIFLEKYKNSVLWEGLVSKIRNVFIIVSYIWMVTAVFLLTRLIKNMVILRKYITRYSDSIHTIHISDILVNACRKYDLKNSIEDRIQLKVCKFIKSPFVAWIRKPQILIPNLKLSDAELNLIVEHEIVHIKHGDNLVKILMSVVLCIHWFNPVIYIWRKQLTHYCELACDETVSRTMKHDEKKKYAIVLIDIVEKSGCKGTHGDVCAWFSGETAGLEERIMNIMKGKCMKKRTEIIIGILVVIVCVSICLCGALVSAKNYKANEIQPDIQHKSDTNTQYKYMNISENYESIISNAFSSYDEIELSVLVTDINGDVITQIGDVGNQVIPGSIFKPIIAACLIQSGEYTGESILSDELFYVKDGNRNIPVSEWKNDDQILSEVTLDESLKESLHRPIGKAFLNSDQATIMSLLMNLGVKETDLENDAEKVEFARGQGFKLPVSTIAEMYRNILVSGNAFDGGQSIFSSDVVEHMNEVLHDYVKRRSSLYSDNGALYMMENDVAAYGGVATEIAEASEETQSVKIVTTFSGVTQIDGRRVFMTIAVGKNADEGYDLFSDKLMCMAGLIFDQFEEC